MKRETPRDMEPPSAQTMSYHGKDDEQDKAVNEWYVFCLLASFSPPVFEKFCALAFAGRVSELPVFLLLVMTVVLAVVPAASTAHRAASTSFSVTPAVKANAQVSAQRPSTSPGSLWIFKTFGVCVLFRFVCDSSSV